MGSSVCLGNIPSFAWVLWRGVASSRRVRPPVLVASARLLCARAPSGLQAIKSCSHVWRAPLMRTARRGGCRRRASSAPGRSPPGVRFRGSAVVCPWGFPHRWHLCAATPAMEFDHVRARSATVVVLGSMKRTMRVLRRLVCVVSPPLLDPSLARRGQPEHLLSFVSCGKVVLVGPVDIRQWSCPLSAAGSCHGELSTGHGRGSLPTVRACGQSGTLGRGAGCSLACCCPAGAQSAVDRRR